VAELERCLDSQRASKEEELERARAEARAEVVGKDEQIRSLERKALRERVKMQSEVEEMRGKENQMRKEIAEGQNMCQILEDKIETFKAKETDYLMKISEEESKSQRMYAMLEKL